MNSTLQNSSAGGHDAPIANVSEDLLNGVGVARAIHRVIHATPPLWSTRIGLYGVWGSGKTSILNLLQKIEEADGALVVRFSAWAASSDSNVIAQFYQALAKKLQDEQIQLSRTHRLKSALSRSKGLVRFAKLLKIGAEELSPMPPVATKAVIEVLSALSSKAGKWSRIGKEDLNRVIGLLNHRKVVVFIDDLDRADPKEIPKALLALRELLDWPGFSFVLAFDKRAIASALADYSRAFGEDAQGFIEKVVDVPFEVPQPTKDFKTAFASQAFKTCCPSMPLVHLDEVLGFLPAQPRRLKIIARMMGSLQRSLERHDVSEVDWSGLLLYLILREGSERLASWVLTELLSEKHEWSMWIEEKEREAKKTDLIAKLTALIGAPTSTDSSLLTEAAVRLLSHWETIGEDKVKYWTQLFYSEPCITSKEYSVLVEEYAKSGSRSLVDGALEIASRVGGVSLEAAAAACISLGITNYQNCLSLMAQSRLQVDLDENLAAANKSLLLLEHLCSQSANLSLAKAAAAGGIGASLLGAFSQWVAWTRNVGEEELRIRELNLVRVVCERTREPEAVFKQTDPFWESHHGQDARSSEMAKTWKAQIRSVLTPRIVAKLIDKFLVPDGLTGVVSGEESELAWLVENPASPLYTEEKFSTELAATLGKITILKGAERIALAKNSFNYLRQILFQTRDASWASGGGVRDIQLARPELITAAWLAASSEPVPFRMRSAFSKLRADLLINGVKEEQLPHAYWMDKEEPVAEFDAYESQEQKDEHENGSSVESSRGI